MPSHAEPLVPALDRRAALGLLAATGAAAALAPTLFAADQNAQRPLALPPEFLGWDAAKGEYVLSKLPYAYDALEPHLDAQTMQIHHEKHHQAYVTGLNKALAELAKIRAGSDASLIKHWSRELAFHGGGHVNHTLFWLCMAPPASGGGGQPTGPLAETITRDFGSFDAFSKHFQAAAGAVEGSGWAWLVFDHISRRLFVQQMEKQQDMLITGVTPLMGVDVWEHAYYLRYQNRRADYVKAFMNVVNWPRIQAMFEYITGSSAR
jgi:Fe-Mn family superoxide dismutase